MELLTHFTPGRDLVVDDEELFRPSKFYPHVRDILLHRASDEVVYRQLHNRLLVDRNSVTPSVVRRELHHHARASLALFSDDLPIIGEASKKAGVRSALGEAPEFISDQMTDKVVEMAFNIHAAFRKKKNLPKTEKAALAGLEQDLARMAAISVSTERPTRGDMLDLARVILDEKAPAISKRITLKSNPLLAGKTQASGRIIEQRRVLALKSQLAAPTT
jgi:hypothetical protein